MGGGEAFRSNTSLKKRSPPQTSAVVSQNTDGRERKTTSPWLIFHFLFFLPIHVSDFRRRRVSPRLHVMVFLNAFVSYVTYFWRSEKEINRVFIGFITFPAHRKGHVTSRSCTSFVFSSVFLHVPATEGQTTTKVININQFSVCVFFFFFTFPAHKRVRQPPGSYNNPLKRLHITPKPGPIHALGSRKV